MVGKDQNSFQRVKESKEREEKADIEAILKYSQEKFPVQNTTKVIKTAMNWEPKATTDQHIIISHNIESLCIHIFPTFWDLYSIFNAIAKEKAYFGTDEVLSLVGNC